MRVSTLLTPAIAWAVSLSLITIACKKSSWRLPSPVTDGVCQTNSITLDGDPIDRTCTWRGFTWRCNTIQCWRIAPVAPEGLP